MGYLKCPPSETLENITLCFKRIKKMTLWWVAFFLFISNEQNKLYNSCIKSLHLIFLKICRFEAILGAEVYKLIVYFDPMNRDYIYLYELSFLHRQWSKQHVSGRQRFLELWKMSEYSRLSVFSSAEGMKVL